MKQNYTMGIAACVLIVLATVVVQTKFACGYGQRLEDLIVDPQCDWKGEPSEGELLAVGLHQSAPFGLGEGDANRFEDVQSSTYGEIAYASLAEALHNPLVNSSGNFVDLGSGTGLTLMAAVLEAHGSDTMEVIGVELSRARHDVACEQLRRLSAAMVPFKLRQERVRRVASICGDMFDVPLGSFTTVYVSSLCFPEPLLYRLAQHLSNNLHAGSTVLSLRRFPDASAPRLQHVGHTVVRTTWTRAACLEIYNVVDCPGTCTAAHARGPPLHLGSGGWEDMCSYLIPHKGWKEERN